MSARYRYNHRSVKHHHYILIAVVICLVLVGGLVALVVNDMRHSSSGTVTGPNRVVGQVVGDNSEKHTIDELFYSFSLPNDWKETARVNNSQEQSIAWTGSKKTNFQRSLKLYIDVIPPDIAINRAIPVTVSDSTLQIGDVSDNCATFTQGGTLDTDKAVKLKPAPAKYSGVDFICNLPNVVENQVGTASRDGVNQFRVTGPNKGTHKYFFLYTDHSIQPDYSILIDALSSFQAK